MTGGKSAQGNRVQQELEILRQKQLAKSQRNRLKDTHGHLATPEEAQAFLASMRDKSHQRESFGTTASHRMSTDGIDSWYLHQRQREKELRQRRQEAEALLRGYRGSLDPTTIQAMKQQRGHNPRQSYDVEGHTNFVQVNEDQQIIESLTQSNSMATPKHSFSFNDTSHIVEEKKEDDILLKSSSQETSCTPMPTEFEQPETIWRGFVSDQPGAKFAPEAGRYHLYCSYACPGSHRALIIRSLKGLEDVVSVTIVHPTWRLTNPDDSHDRHRGWVFGDPFGAPFSNTIGRGGPFLPAYNDNDPDPLFNAFSIREIYEYAEDTSGKYTIPLLWDKKLNTIVNNDSSDISYMFNSCFNSLADNPNLDLYTEYDQEGMTKLNEVSEWLSPLMIHGVYKCGFAKTQRAYDRAIDELCIAFDRADDILQQQRFLTGDAITDADIRLFVTLIRFDEVYAFYFKANARLVMLTPSLLNFCRDIYQLPQVAKTCDMEQIKAHFFGSHAEWNKYSVIPRGLGFMELLDMAHDRHLLSPPSTDEDWDENLANEI